MSNIKFQAIIQGNPINLSTEDMIQFKVYCSSLNLTLDKWINIAQTLYRVEPSQCLEFLLYIEKHELQRPAFRDFTHQNSKIHIYNSLAGLHLTKAIKQAPKQQIDRNLAETRRYINASQKVKMTAGRVYLTLRGFIYFYDGNFDLAAGNFNKSIETNPEDQSHSIIGMLGLAQLYFARRNYEMSLTYYKRALGLNKALPTRARLGMAYCFYQLQKYQLAKFCFKRINDLEPTCIEAQIGYATLQYYSGNKDLYFKTLQNCYQRNKNHPLVLLHLAQHYLLIKNRSKVIGLCQRGLNQLKKFSIFVDKSQSYRNDQIQFRCRFHHLLGLVYHESSQYQLCLKHYNMSLNKQILFPNINLAQAYINPNNINFVQATKLLDQVHRQIPQKIKKLLNQTYRSLAYIKSKATSKKQKAESIQMYNQAIKYNPKDVQSLIQNGNLLLQTDHRKCLSLYQAAFKILKQQNQFIHPELFNNIGVLKIYTKDDKQAQKFLLLALQHIEIWKKHSTEDQQIKNIKQKAFLATFNFNLAVLFDEANKFEQALKYYAKVLEINPLYLDVYVRLAYFEFRNGNIKEAFKKCQQGIKIAEESRAKIVKPDRLILMKAYIFRMIGDERNSKQTLQTLQKDTYTFMFEQSLDYDVIIQKSDSNTRNLRENLKAKFQNCLKLCQDDHHNIYAYMLLGILLAQLQKPRQASQCFSLIKQFDNQHPKILYNLGIYHFKHQQYENALLVLKKYIQKSNGHFQSELTLAIILFLQSRFQQAIKSMKKLVLLYPGSLIVRFNLHIFTQRYSENNLDHKNKQISKTRKSISYLRRLYIIFNYFSKLNVNQYLKSIQNHQLKQKLKQQIIKIREKCEDQKVYIKSREESYGNYQRQAQQKERIIDEEKRKLENKLKEINQMRYQSQLEQNKRIQQENQRRRIMILKQKQLEQKLNQSYRQQLDQKARENQLKKTKVKSKRPKNDKDDEYQLQKEDQYLVEMPKEDKPRNVKKLRKIRKQREQSSEDVYQEPNRNLKQVEQQRSMQQQHYVQRQQREEDSMQNEQKYQEKKSQNNLQKQLLEDD